MKQLFITVSLPTTTIDSKNNPQKVVNIQIAIEAENELDINEYLENVKIIDVSDVPHLAIEAVGVKSK